MRLSVSLFRNLNKPDWNKRVWQIGYRGPSRLKARFNHRPDGPVSRSATSVLRERFDREYNVMRWLANPYITKEKESAYLNVYGNVDTQLIHQMDLKKQLKMPGEPKILNDKLQPDRRRANVGNLLHFHRTIEDSLSDLIKRNRWD